MIDGSIGLPVCSFQLAVGTMLGSGPFDELAMRQGAEEALMEKDKEQSDSGSLFRERVGIAATAAGDQPMRLHFTQVIT